MEIVIAVGIGLVVLFILFKIFKAFLKWSIIILLLLLAVAYFTNPEEATHHKSLKDTAKDLRLKKVKEKFIKVKDYKIFSVTKVTVKGEEKIVGIGAFGKVWYFDDIKDKLTKQKE